MKQVGLGLVLVLVGAVSRAAAEPRWSIESVEVSRLASVIEQDGDAAKGELVLYEKTVRPEAGQALLAIAVTVEVDWVPEDDKLAVTADQVAVTADDRPVQILGVGGPIRGGGPVVLMKEPIRLWALNRRHGPPTTTIKRTWIGLAPADPEELTLNVADKTVTAAIPDQISSPAPSDWLTFSTPEAQLAEAYGNRKAGEGMQLLKLSVKLTPVRPSYVDEDGEPWFQFDTSSLNVRVGDTVLPVLGYWISGRFIKSTSYNIGVPYRPEMTPHIEPIFEIPAAATQAQLLWRGHPVAHVDLAPAASE